MHHSLKSYGVEKHRSNILFLYFLKLTWNTFTSEIKRTLSEELYVFYSFFTHTCNIGLMKQ